MVQTVSLSPHLEGSIAYAKEDKNLKIKVAQSADRVEFKV